MLLTLKYSQMKQIEKKEKSLMVRQVLVEAIEASMMVSPVSVLLN
jgi:hypothetical protein